MKMRRTPRKSQLRFLVVMIIGTIAVVPLFLLAGFGDVTETLIKARKEYLFLALATTILALFVRGIRWSSYLRAVGCKTRFGTVFSTLLAGCFFENVTPARIGEFFRPLILRSKDKTSISMTMPTVLVERILDLGVSSIIAFLGILLMLDLQPSLRSALVIGILAMAVLIGLVLFLPKVLGFVIRQGLKAARALRIGWRKEVVQEMSDATTVMEEGVYALLRNKSATMLGLMLTVLLWLLNGLRLCFVLKSLDLNVSLFQATVVVVLTILLATASMIPFGHGTAELAMSSILASSSLGFPVALSVSAAIIDKLLAVWFIVLIGGIVGSGLGYFKLVGEKKATNTTKQELKQ